MAKSIFTRYDNIKKLAGEGSPYAVDCYMQYVVKFSKDDRDLIAKFRKDYEANQNDISVIEGYTEQQVKVITMFLNFAYGLPEDETDFQKFVQRIKEADQKAEKEQGKKLLDFSTEQQFLQNRFKRSRNYFSDTASKFKKTYHRVQHWVMGLSLAVSMVSLLFIFMGNLIWDEGSMPKWFGNLDNFIVAVISGIAAWLSSNDKLCRNLEFWVKYRTISEALKKECRRIWAHQSRKTFPHQLRGNHSGRQRQFCQHPPKQHKRSRCQWRRPIRQHPFGRRCKNDE